MSFYDEWDDENIVDCPTCFEPNAPVGALGLTLHYTCRFCGIWYAVREKETHEVQ